MPNETRMHMAEGMPTNAFVIMAGRFLFYRVLSRFSFYVPILVVALVAFGYGFLSIGTILFAYGLSTLFFGGWARRVAERQGVTASIVTGELLKGLSNAAMAAILSGLAGGVGESRTTVAVIVAQIIGGAGYALAATGDGNFLAKAAVVLGDSSRQRQAQAHSSSAMFISFLMAGVAGALMYRVHPWLPFVMTAVANGLAGIWAAIMLRLPVGTKVAGSDGAKKERPSAQPGANTEGWPAKKRHGEAKAQPTPMRATDSALRNENGTHATEAHDADGNAAKTENGQSLKGAAIWGDVLAYALVRASVIVLQLLILPVWFFLGLKLDISLFGVIFAIYTLTGFLGGRYYPVLASKMGERRGRMALFAITVFSLFLAGLSGNSWLALAAPVGAFAGAGMVRPALLPKLSAAGSRAVSLAERLFGLLTAILYLAGGMALDAGMTPSELAFWSAVILSVGIALLEGLKMLSSLAAASVPENRRKPSM